METAVNIIKEVFIALWGVPYLPEGIITTVTIVVIQWLKIQVWVAKQGLAKYAPWLSVLVSVLLMLINAYLMRKPLESAVAPGIIAGLAASGLYSTARVPGKGNPASE